ncbi:MAG: hypothetical protein ACYCZD_10080 [Rhodanobacter sp.]
MVAQALECYFDAMHRPGAPQVKVDFAVLTFNQIKDPVQRSRFNAMPTTFRLQPAHAVHGKMNLFRSERAL